MPWILIVTLLLAACKPTSDTALSFRDATLAEVNGSRITVDQFNQEWSKLPNDLRAAYTGTDGKKEFLGELITRELLLEKARRMKLDQDRTIADRTEALRKRLLLDAVLHELVEKKIEVTDQEMSAYFETHRNALPMIEEARAAHILVRTEAEAKELQNRLRRGAGFAALARTRSIDPGSRDKGGDLGLLRRGRMQPDIEEAVFGLKPGRTSGIIKTAYGYHLIRVQSRRSRKPLSPDDVRDEIRNRIAKDKEAALFDALVGTLKAESTIIISDSSLASIGDPVAPNHDPASDVRP